MGRRKGRKAKQRAKARSPEPREYTATLPSGRKRRVDSTRGLPKGSMVTWNDPKSGEMRWTVIGGGWPFDD